MKSDAKTRDQHFIEYLNRLAVEENRAVLAVLRRGISLSSDRTVAMYRYVASWVAEDERNWQEECLYLVAALFAQYPNAKPSGGNLGDSLRLLSESSTSTSIERRFVALMTANTHELRSHLRHLIALLAAKNIELNWLALLRDLRRWKHPTRHVERAWARHFWRNLPSEANGKQNGSPQEVSENEA